MVTMEPEDFLFWLARWIATHPKGTLMVILGLIILGIFLDVFGVPA